MIVFKYHTERVNEWYTMDLPADAQILDFQAQPQQHVGRAPRLCLWVATDDPRTVHAYEILVVGTGLLFDDHHAQYIGTTQAEGCVWHLFIRDYRS